MGKVLKCDEDTKKLYNLVNNLTGSIKTTPMPDNTSEESSTEKFGDYFMGEIERIRDELKDAPTFQPSQSPNLKSKLINSNQPLRRKYAKSYSPWPKAL